MSIGKIKIVHIGQSLGGVETYIRLLISNLDVNQFDQVIIHGKNDIEKDFIDKSNSRIKEYSIGLKRSINLFIDTKALFDTVKILKAERPNLIHCHSSKGGMIGRVAGFIVGIHSYYTPNAFSYLSTDSKIIRNIFLLYEKVFSRFNSTLLACSLSEYNRGLYEVGYKKSKVKIWNNSIPFITVTKNSNNNERNYILSIGRPSFQKNTAFLIEVMNVLINEEKLDLRLKLVGVGLYSPLKTKIEALIVKYDLQNYVDLIEWVPKNEVLDYISNCIFYISTSRYEGLPYSILECMSLGKPTIASKVDGNQDAVEHGITGFLYEEGNIADCIKYVKLILNDKTIQHKMSQSCFKSFSTSFNIRANIKKLEKIYLADCK